MTTFLTDFQTLLIFVIILLFIRYNWNRRRLYYHAFKIPGPFSLPFFGGTFHVTRELLQMRGSIDAYNVIYKILMRENFKEPIVKYWFLHRLYFAVFRLQDLEIVLRLCLEKDSFYHFLDESWKDSLLSVTPIHVWKQNRKFVVRPFATNKIHSFIDVFAKYGRKLVEDLRSSSMPVDIIHKIWLANLQTSCETLANVDPDLVGGHEIYLKSVSRGEQITIARVYNPLLYSSLVWKFSSLSKEALKHQKIRNEYITRIFNLIDKNNLQDDCSNHLLPFLRHTYKKDNFTEDQLLNQTNFILFAATETTAITMGFVLFLLGLHPDIQDKVFDELLLVFGNEDRNPSLEDINQLHCLDRVIKETLRLFPPVPIISRAIDRDIKLDACTLPAGAFCAIPIGYLHRREEFWPNPLKFDPDRFLPENVAQRHKCLFIPFSYGPRNCLGYKYGMVSMKVLLSTLLRQFRVKASNYKSIEEVDFDFSVAVKPKKGLFIELERSS